MKSAAGRPEVIGIQYLRALAAIMVALTHIGGSMGQAKYVYHEPFGGLLEAGWFGVPLFFCISGWIMAYIATNADRSRRTTPRAFLTARFVRIIPFMWLAILLYAGLRFVFRHEFLPWDTLRAMTLFPLPVGKVSPPQVWTLTFELLFYLIFALAFLGRKPLSWVFVLWMAASAISAFIPGEAAMAASGWLGDLVFNYLFRPLNLMFGAGALAGWLHLRHPPARTLPRAAAWLTPMLAVAGALAWRFSGAWNLAVGLIACPLLLTFAASLPTDRRPAAKLSELLGNASYSTYMTHGIVLTAFLGVAHKLPPLADGLLVGVCLLLCLVFGVASYRWLEKPMIAVARRLARPGRSALTASAVAEP